MKTKEFNELSDNIKKDIISFIEKNQPEIYWDYNDEMSTEQVDDILENGLEAFEDSLVDLNFDYICEIENDLIDQCLAEFEDSINNDLNTENNEAWIEDFKEFCLDYICVDLNAKELLRKYGEDVFFYNTGLYIEEPFEDNVNESIRNIKNMLSIDSNEFDNDLKELVENAAYGGELVVYFTETIENILDLKKENRQSIEFFGNVSIAIIDTNNGSGYDIKIKHSFSLPFNYENIYFERSIKYNYTFEVCGMDWDFCRATKYVLTDKLAEKS